MVTNPTLATFNEEVILIGGLDEAHPKTPGLPAQGDGMTDLPGPTAGAVRIEHEMFRTCGGLGHEADRQGMPQVIQPGGQSPVSWIVEKSLLVDRCGFIGAPCLAQQPGPGHPGGHEMWAFTGRRLIKSQGQRGAVTVEPHPPHSKEIVHLTFPIVDRRQPDFHRRFVSNRENLFRQRGGRNRSDVSGATRAP